jgi:hypothetical protein
VDAPCEYYHYMVKGLARDPSQRYASMEEMERVLEAILDGKPPINLGGYQGHGALVSAGAFVPGTLTGITLMKRAPTGTESARREARGCQL